MKKQLIVLSFMCSCAALEPTHNVKVVNLGELRNAHGAPITRQTKYMDCILKLMDAGINQQLLKELCNATYGGNE